MGGEREDKAGYVLGYSWRITDCIKGGARVGGQKVGRKGSKKVNSHVIS